MNNHRFISVNEQSHDKTLSGVHGVFITQREFRKQIPLAVTQYCKDKGILFLDKIEIATETLSPLAIEAVTKICKRLGYKSLCKNTSERGRYLGSDGGGHYSTDFYEIFEYGLITITG